MKLFAIWCKEARNNKGDWMRELPSKVSDGGIAILTFESKQAACHRAALAYGFQTYKEAKAKGWCEVRLFYVFPQ